MAAMDVSADNTQASFDFDSLATRYGGWPLVYRLKHIAARKPVLSKRAYSLAMEAVRNTTQDGASYESFARMAGVPADDWGKQAVKKADAHRASVERELQIHTAQAIRENVRVSRRNTDCFFCQRCSHTVHFSAEMLRRQSPQRTGTR